MKTIYSKIDGLAIMDGKIKERRRVPCSLYTDDRLSVLEKRPSVCVCVCACVLDRCRSKEKKKCSDHRLLYFRTFYVSGRRIAERERKKEQDDINTK
ncbi:hypothetical protein BCR43DRAFT_2696 [Syncephalastrum racemosum]|uniref:Uncharacterized protein n=1 Tax=Syncephalastrum racemosum TaxID=13706 RepID=A0A1X2HRL8_SYNRA|nr:hypothetical protein BCR43DRAFT_2696 [Syncephalastrum racemosum]